MTMKEYKISRGCHRSGIHIDPHFGLKEMTFVGYFDRHCWTHALGGEDDYDINKFYGLSFGRHHTNSIRLGWRPNYEQPGVIDLFSYVYRDGERMEPEFILSVSVDSLFACRIKLFDTGRASIGVKTDLRYDNDYRVVNFEFAPERKWGYRLYPYHGGNRKAYQTMFFGIQEN